MAASFAHLLGLAKPAGKRRSAAKATSHRSGKKAAAAAAAATGAGRFAHLLTAANRYQAEPADADVDREQQRYLVTSARAKAMPELAAWKTVVRDADKERREAKAGRTRQARSSAAANAIVAADRRRRGLVDPDW
jgi:hypothetical protein